MSHLKVSITRDSNESNAIVEGLNNIEATDLFKNCDTIVVIANWVNDQKVDPKDGVVVGTESLRTVLKYLKQIQGKRVVVATGSGGGDSEKIMKEVGYDQILIQEGVDFIDFNHGPYVVESIDHKIIKKLKVNELLTENVKIVSFTQLKMHEEAVMSASTKNMALSIPSSEEHGHPKKNLGIHDDLHGFIAAMANRFHVDLAIVSASPAMLGTGPTKGVAVNTGMVIVGNNAVATDTICARLLGLKVQAIAYLYLIEQKHKNLTDLNKIKVKGIDLLKAEEIFSTEVYGQKIQVDQN